MRAPHLHRSASAPCIHSVLLLSSHHCLWVGLRTLLRTQRRLRIVAEVRQADEVVPTVERLRPHMIFAPVRLEGASTVPCLAQVRASHPDIKVLVLGDELDHNALIQLVQAGINGYLLWKSLSPLVLHHCLAAVLEGGLWVGSPAAVERLVSPPESSHNPNDRGIVLSAHEQNILQGLAAGLKQREIAHAEYVSEATIERTLGRLRNMFGVCSTYALCVKAGRLGFAG
jgi:two-component system nitrate/nitrite response regulator NarL